MKAFRVFTVAAVIASAALLVSGCSSDNSPNNGGVPELKMVGSDKCQTCHTTQYNDWHNSGHPYKLNKVVNGQPPTYPHSTVPNPPTPYTWNDVTYVIGGYGWKARFLDKDGFIITGQEVQYNLPRPDLGTSTTESEWVPYHTGVDSLQYNCGRCHTTGWKTLEENGGVHQDSLIGIAGTWFETGITCERCHGPGSQHVADPKASNIQVDESPQLCGQCHYRDENHGILVSGGFIRHHEQYDELMSAGHQGRKCVDCHDPHKSTRYDAPGAIKVECTSCHASKATKIKHPDGPECSDCHMPHASKSARTVNKYRGDLPTHIFEINTNPYPKDSMFYEKDGKTWARGFVTLDFACYSCHTDENGVGGGTAPQKTLTELSDFAKGMHD